MNDYAKAAGRSARSTAAIERKPEKLSPAEQVRVAEAKAFVCQHLPEAVPLIRSLVEEGMADGWRSVIDYSLIDPDSHGR